MFLSSNSFYKLCFSGDCISSKFPSISLILSIIFVVIYFILMKYIVMIPPLCLMVKIFCFSVLLCCSVSYMLSWYICIDSLNHFKELTSVNFCFPFQWFCFVFFFLKFKKLFCTYIFLLASLIIFYSFLSWKLSS